MPTNIVVIDSNPTTYTIASVAMGSTDYKISYINLTTTFDIEEAIKKNVADVILLDLSVNDIQDIHKIIIKAFPKIKIIGIQHDNTVPIKCDKTLRRPFKSTDIKKIVLSLLQNNVTTKKVIIASDSDVLRATFPILLRKFDVEYEFYNPKVQIPSDEVQGMIIEVPAYEKLARSMSPYWKLAVIDEKHASKNYDECFMLLSPFSDLQAFNICTNLLGERKNKSNVQTSGIKEIVLTRDQQTNFAADLSISIFSEFLKSERVVVQPTENILKTIRVLVYDSSRKILNDEKK